MALRGVLRDILSIYLGYKILGMWFFGSAYTPSIGWAALMLLLLSVWFVLERVGVL